LLLFVSTPIGNLEDISLRALKALESCEVVLCEDSRVASKLFKLLEQKSCLSPKNREFIPLHSHNQKEFIERVDKSFFDRAVIYISDAGMPCISDPGSELVRYAQQNDIGYDFIPGANALSLAYGMSGYEGGFLFIGFLPHTKKERLAIIEESIFLGYNTIFYEAPTRILQLVEEILSFDENIELFAVKELTKLHQKYFKAEAKAMLEILKKQNLKGEWSIISKALKKESNTLNLSQLKSLDLPPKISAKIESLMTGLSVKDIYNAGLKEREK